VGGVPCFAGAVRAALAGQDRGGARSARFSVGGRRVARDGARPLARTVDRREHLGRPHSHGLRVAVRMSDGRRATLTRRYRVCGNSR
jgi:hypothetical protein